MKLYYSPGTCSLSPHIVLREAGLPFELERVDTGKHTTASGADYYAINPKGYVPALELDDGALLTEGAAIVQFIADQRPEAKLVPAPGTLGRARLHEQLNFIASELHKAFGPLFHPDGAAASKQTARQNVERRLDLVEGMLADGRKYLLGERFSVADAYLFAVIRWTKPTGIDLSKWPALSAFFARMATRDSVQAAMKQEGLQ